jgi:hypothetical protein
MRHLRHTHVLALALLTTAAVGLVALADARVVPRRTTLIASPPPETGRVADASSDNPTWSQDERIVRLLAYDSAASTIVPGDGNGRRDVFVMRRGSAQGDVGGDTQIASIGPNGQANGDSQRPSLDGTGRRVRPHCVAFESTATNLHADDTTADSDVYVRDLRANTTRLVSTGALPDATNASIDGRCSVVTFEAGGIVYARNLRGRTPTRIAAGTDPDQQTNAEGVAYVRARQVRHRRFERTRSGIRLVGRELLVSRGPNGAGNGESSSPVADDSGYYVAFQSIATNLCGRSQAYCRGIRRDSNGATSDVFRATISRRAPTRDRIQMASFSYAVRAQGNGASTEPAMSGGGEFVFFTSRATNLRQSTGIRNADPNGTIPDVYLWNFPRSRGYGNVSRESRPGPSGELNGPSMRPATSNRGNYLAFVSFATDAPGDRNGGQIGDVFVRFLGGR